MNTPKGAKMTLWDRDNWQNTNPPVTGASRSTDKQSGQMNRNQNEKANQGLKMCHTEVKCIKKHNGDTVQPTLLSVYAIEEKENI